MIRTTIIILFVCLLSARLVAQDNQWPLSEKHQRKLEKTKDEAKRDKLRAKFLKQDSAKYQKLANRIKKKLSKTAKDSINRYVDVPAVGADSTIIKDSKNKAISAAKDSLGNRYGVPSLPADSTIVGQAKQEGKRIALDTLNNYVDVPDVTIDSTTKKQVISELKTTGKTELQKELDMEIPDIKLDSTVTDQAKTELKTRGKGLLEDELGESIPDIKMDSAVADQIAVEAEKRAEKALQEKGMSSLKDLPADSELGKLNTYKDQLEQTQQELRQGAAKQKIKEKMAASAKQFIQENAKQISQVQSKMGELKQKYSYVPNSNDLSTAKKRTSLKDESLWKRLVIGGNFNVTKTNPLRIDLSPVLGYKINKLFEIGVTGTFRTQFNADKNGVTQNGEEVFGFGLFADHMVFKNFFGHIEGESLRSNVSENENQRKVWNQTLLIGIGRKFNVAKWLEMQALILYNPLHDNSDGIYNSPVVFKTGIRVRK